MHAELEHRADAISRRPASFGYRTLFFLERTASLRAVETLAVLIDGSIDVVLSPGATTRCFTRCALSRSPRQRPTRLVTQWETCD